MTRACLSILCLFVGASAGASQRAVVDRDLRVRPVAKLLSLSDGRIEIEPVPLDVSVTSVDGVAVASPQEPVPVLSADTVATTRDRLRDERG